MGIGNRKIETNQEHLDRLSRKTSNLKRFFFVLFALWVIAWLLMFGIACYGAFDLTLSGLTHVEGIFNAVIVFATGVVFTFIFVIIYRILKDIAQGNSPFEYVQVKRIRRIAWILVAYVVIDMISASNLSAFISSGGFGIENSSFHESPTLVLSINFGVLVSAVVVYGLSIIFEYGSVLQEQSDETL